MAVETIKKDLAGAIVIDGIIYLKNNGGLICEIDDSSYILKNGKNRAFIDENHPLFNQVKDLLDAYELREEIHDFVSDRLIDLGLLEKEPVIEIGSSLERSFVRRFVSRGVIMNSMLVNPHIDFNNCENIAFTNVLSGEVLTGSQNLWMTSHELKDASGNNHPDLKWAEANKDMPLAQSTLLCLSRRRDIVKLVSQFDHAFVGYYGVMKSKSFEWETEFFDKEFQKFNGYKEVEEATILSNGDVAALHLLVK